MASILKPQNILIYLSIAGISTSSNPPSPKPEKCARI